MRILKPCLSVHLSICPYPEKRNHPGFINISPTLRYVFAIASNAERQMQQAIFLATSVFVRLLNEEHVVVVDTKGDRHAPPPLIPTPGPKFLTPHPPGSSHSVSGPRSVGNLGQPNMSCGCVWHRGQFGVVCGIGDSLVLCGCVWHRGQFGVVWL